MTYSEWIAKSKEVAGTAGKATKALGITTSAIYKSAGSDSDGQVHVKYEYMLLGLEFSKDTYLQRCVIHKENPLLIAALDQLDT